MLEKGFLGKSHTIQKAAACIYVPKILETKQLALSCCALTLLCLRQHNLGNHSFALAADSNVDPHVSFLARAPYGQVARSLNCIKPCASRKPYIGSKGCPPLTHGLESQKTGLNPIAARKNWANVEKGTKEIGSN